jgi:hypothetical protein
MEDAEVAIDVWNKRPIAPPVAARGGQLQESLVSLYRYKALPRTVTPGGPIMATITEVFESVNDNTRITIETSNGGASLRAEKLSSPVAAGSVDNLASIDHEMNPTLYSFAKAWCVSKVGVPAGKCWDEMISFIDAWGAQQRQYGWDQCAMLNQEAIRQQRQRAEKAEARTKELELDLLLKNPLVEELRSDIRGFKDRVKELEEQLVVAKRYYLTS